MRISEEPDDKVRRCYSGADDGVFFSNPWNQVTDEEVLSNLESGKQEMGLTLGKGCYSAFRYVSFYGFWNMNFSDKGQSYFFYQNPR